MFSKPKYLSMVVAASIAAPLPLAAETFEPAALPIGDTGVALRPLLDIGLGYDDNLLHTESDKEDSFFNVLTLRGDVGAGDAVSNFALDYLLSNGTYFSSSDDNYTDFGAELSAHHEFTARHRIDPSIEFQRKHDARGTGISEGRGDELDSPVEFDELRAGITYGFGVATARFNADLKLNYYQKEYQDFRDITRFRDYDSLTPGAVVYWNIMPKTSLTFEVSREAIEYDEIATGDVSRDSDVIRALAGVTWEITGKTTGYAKLGVEDKSFDESERDDFTGFAWDIGLEWNTRTYSTIYLGTGFRTTDPDTFGDYIEETTVDLSWVHEWKERFSTTLGAGYLGEDYTGIDRDDTFYSAYISAEYDFRRWLLISLTYTYSDQSSDIDATEYDKNLVMLTFTAGL